MKGNQKKGKQHDANQTKLDSFFNAKRKRTHDKEQGKQDDEEQEEPLFLKPPTQPFFTPSPDTSNERPLAKQAKQTRLEKEPQASQIRAQPEPEPESQPQPQLPATVIAPVAPVAQVKTDPPPPLTTDVLQFDPQSYPLLSSGETRAPYQFLTEAFTAVASTTSRLVIRDVLCNMLRVLICQSPDDVLPAVWLCSNALAGAYEGVELGIGPLVLTKAITSITGTTPQKLRKLYNDHGDWGDVAFAVKQSVRTIIEPKPLRISTVFDTLHAIAAAKGKGAVETKAGLVKRLLLSAKGEQVRYVIRTCVAHLRIGAVRNSILVALARAFVLTSPPSASPPLADALVRRPTDTTTQINAKLKHSESLMKECYAQCPNWNSIVPWLLETGDVSRIFERCGLRVGVPLRPMLGQITRAIGNVFARLEGRDFSCEFKYDGQRAQIHVDAQGRVKIYSRHLEDMTDKYPDIARLLPSVRSETIESFILDAEIVAIGKDGTILPFQTLSNRGRKNVTVETISIDVCVLAFDIMYLNGESLLQLPFRERRQHLRNDFKVIPHRFDFVTSIDAAGDPAKQDDVHAFFKQSMSKGCEGMMVKVLDDVPANGNGRILSTYEPDKRVESWLKVKKDYLEGVGDSLDLVPIGAWYGNGRKVGWYSPILLACYNAEDDTLESVCKCMSGFTDTFYKELKNFYSLENGRILSKPRHDYVTDYQPDVWFDATSVWEIRGADITISPVHKGAVGRVDPDRGLSLRFPRFIRVREDKPIEEATSSEQLAELFMNQSAHKDTTEEYDE